MIIEVIIMSGIMKCKRMDPSYVGEKYAAVLAHTLTWDSAIGGDVATFPIREVRYLGEFTSAWHQGSGGDRTTYYAFNLDGQMLTVRSSEITCFIDAKQEDYPHNVPRPIDAYITIT